MDDILATVEISNCRNTATVEMTVVSQADGRQRRRLWWERGASSSPWRYVRDIAISHPHSPNSGMGRTVSCSPFPADDSKHLLLSDLVQILLILYHTAERKT